MIRRTSYLKKINPESHWAQILGVVRSISSLGTKIAPTAGQRQRLWTHSKLGSCTGSDTMISLINLGNVGFEDDTMALLLDT